ncbi:MFS transporter [Catellatospora bangladeshensis]|uniref:Arabinose transporter n=1 Tax=Catellatospora bangladeshensis TaxID=310355 RepID=A0A8J3NJS8_9ACTN|nr:MFS transporter [Catellatospora bangladeshensis]GIF82318.1 arabinose transporter [Catellatospora bangladeshensis]
MSRLAFYRPFVPLFGGIFCCLLGVGASLAVLPFYVLGELGLGDVMVGVVVAAIAASAVLTRPVAGRIADRRGYKLVMLAGAVTCTLAGLAYLVAADPVTLIAVRVLHGAGEGMVYTAGAAWLVLLCPPERRGRVVGLYGIHMWAGITLGALFGTLIMKWSGGYPMVWVFCAVASVLGMLLVLGKPRPEQPASTARPAWLPGPALVPGVALALAALGYAALSAFVVLHLDARHIGNGIAAFNAFGVTYVGVRLFLGGLPDKLGANRVALWCVVVEAAGLLIVALAPNLAVAVAGGLVIGAGLSLLFPALALIVINRSAAAQQGAALGAFTSFWDIGLVAGGPLAGLIAGLWGYPAIYFVMAACAAGSAALTLSVLGRRDQVALSPT